MRPEGLAAGASEGLAPGAPIGLASGAAGGLASGAARGLAAGAAFPPEGEATMGVLGVVLGGVAVGGGALHQQMQSPHVVIVSNQ